MAAQVGDLSTPEALAPLSPHDRGGPPPPAMSGVVQASSLARAPSIPDIVHLKPSKILSKPACRKVVAPAESGHPETSAEFAKQMKDRFVLKGPCAPGEQPEGGNKGDSTPNSLSKEMNPIPTEAADVTPIHDVPIPLEFLDSDEILSQVKG